jgi:hypothetical protein
MLEKARMEQLVPLQFSIPSLLHLTQIKVFIVK